MRVIFIGDSMFWNVGNGCDAGTDYGTYHVDNALFCGIGELQRKRSISGTFSVL